MSGIRRSCATPFLLQHELDVYNELVPGESALSATLFIEITDVAAIRPELDRLIGVDEHVALVLGEGAGELRVRAPSTPGSSARSASPRFEAELGGPLRWHLLAGERTPIA